MGSLKAKVQSIHRWSKESALVVFAGCAGCAGFAVAASPSRSMAAIDSDLDVERPRMCFVRFSWNCRSEGCRQWVVDGNRSRSVMPFRSFRLTVFSRWSAGRRFETPPVTFMRFVRFVRLVRAGCRAEVRGSLASGRNQPGPRSQGMRRVRTPRGLSCRGAWSAGIALHAGVVTTGAGAGTGTGTAGVTRRRLVYEAACVLRGVARCPLPAARHGQGPIQSMTNRRSYRYHVRVACWHGCLGKSTRVELI